MFGGFHAGVGAGGWILISLFWIVLLAAVVWPIARIVPSRTGQAAGAGGSSNRPEEPVDILDRRLARGEIDVETYDELRSKLASHPAGGLG
jgi:putative membrane protein